MSAKVLRFPDAKVIGEGSKLAAARVLAGARAHKLNECVVVGYDQDGEIYAASTEGSGDTVWLLEQAKMWLLEGCPEQ